MSGRCKGLLSIQCVRTAGRGLLFVSPLAPLAQLLQAKKEGDLISFNGSILTVEEVY